MKKKLTTLIILSIVALLVIFVAQPYLAINEIRTAAKAYDAERLDRYIDFVSVRASLKEQLNRKLAKEISGGTDVSNPFVMLGTALASGVVEMMVDNYITPAGIADLLEGHRIETKSKQIIPEQRSEKTRAKEKPNVKAAYQSFNTFVVLVGEDDEQQVELILRRKGLSWQVSNIILPQ